MAYEIRVAGELRFLTAESARVAVEAYLDATTDDGAPNGLFESRDLQPKDCTLTLRFEGSASASMYQLTIEGVRILVQLAQDGHVDMGFESDGVVRYGAGGTEARLLIGSIEWKQLWCVADAPPPPRLQVPDEMTTTDTALVLGQCVGRSEPVPVHVEGLAVFRFHVSEGRPPAISCILEPWLRERLADVKSDARADTPPRFPVHVPPPVSFRRWLAQATRRTDDWATVAIQALIAPVVLDLAQARSSEAPGLGSFTVRVRAERRTRNPQTREPMTVPARNVFVFVAASELLSAAESSFRSRRATAFDV